MTEKMRNSFGRISPIFAAILGIGVLSAGILLCCSCAYAQEETDDEIFLDFEKTYIGASGELYYGTNAENWSCANSRGSHAELMTEENGNHAVRLTYDSERDNENYNANAVMNFYDSTSKSKFVGTAGTTYTITFDYKVEETDGKEMQLFVVPSCRENGYPINAAAFDSTDMGPKAVMGSGDFPFDNPATEVITEMTDGWVTAKVQYTAQEAYNNHTVYPILLLQTNGKTKDATHTGNRPYASVLIDNISVAADTTLDFEDTYYNVAGTIYYGSSAENWSAANGRGSNAELVTEESGNHAVRLSYDTENNNENYNANAVMNFYDKTTREKFVGTPGTNYTITFDYKVEETDGKELRLFIVPSCREKGYPVNAASFELTDMGPKAVMGGGDFPFDNPAADVLTEKTDGWKKAVVKYTAQEAYYGHTVYPILLLQTNGKTKDATHTGQRAYASVLIDNIKIRETVYPLVKVTSDGVYYPYDNESESLTVTQSSTALFDSDSIPSKNNALFVGWYKNGTAVRNGDELSENDVLKAQFIEIGAVEHFFVVGAQIRLSENTGLRFVNQFSLSLLERVIDSDIEFAQKSESSEENEGCGFRIIPSDRIDSDKTVQTDEKAKKVAAKNIFDKDEEAFRYTVCVTDITDYARTYTVVPYITYKNANGTEITFYGEEYTASSADIAEAALNDESSDFSEEIKERLSVIAAAKN